MEAIIFALITYIGWGVGDFLVAVSARRIGPFSASFWSLSLSVILLSVYIPFVLSDFAKITLPLLLLNLGLGVIFITGILAFREAFRVGNAALVSVLSAAFSVVTTILSVFVFNEHLSTFQVGTIIITFVGLFLAIFNIQEIRKRNVVFNKATIFGIVAMFAFGIYFTFIKIPVREIGWFWPNYISYLLFPLLIIVMKIRDIPLVRPTANHAFVPLLFSIIIVRIAEFSFNIGISKGFSSVVAPIAGASPTLFVVLAFLFFKDPITRQQVFGIITTLVGIVLLSIFSV